MSLRNEKPLMQQRLTLRRAVLQLIVLWLATTAGLAVVFLVYAAATDELARVQPIASSRSA